MLDLFFLGAQVFVLAPPFQSLSVFVDFDLFNVEFDSPVYETLVHNLLLFLSLLENIVSPMQSRSFYCMGKMFASKL